MGQEARTRSAPFDQGAFLAAQDVGRRTDVVRLLAIFGEETGWEPRLWGASMVGFGRYEYRYASGHGGESLATGFACRPAEISIYVLPGLAGFGELLARLGPHRLGKSCLYLRRLDRVDEAALRALIRAGLAELARQWPVHPV
jgi:hypothetical protein